MNLSLYLEVSPLVWSRYLKVFILSPTDISALLDWPAPGTSLNYVRVLVCQCSHVLIFLGVLFMAFVKRNT